MAPRVTHWDVRHDIPCIPCALHVQDAFTLARFSQVCVCVACAGFLNRSEHGLWGYIAHSQYMLKALQTCHTGLAEHGPSGQLCLVGALCRWAGKPRSGAAAHCRLTQPADTPPAGAWPGLSWEQPSLGCLARPKPPWYAQSADPAIPAGHKASVHRQAYKWLSSSLQVNVACQHSSYSSQVCHGRNSLTRLPCTSKVTVVCSECRSCNTCRAQSSSAQAGLQVAQLIASQHSLPATLLRQLGQVCRGRNSH